MSNYPKGIFNLRVYGVYINDGYVLVSDELYNGIKMTKFPGGGLQYGEGTVECLKREFMEEFGYEIEVKEHFYTTDYFQEAYYFEKTQLISIYYSIDIISEHKIVVANKHNEATEKEPQILRLTPIEMLSAEHFTFPIDKKVLEMIKQRL